MVKVKLPMIEEDIVEDELKVKEYEKEFYVDMSIEAETRFNREFPELKEDLVAYTERVNNWEGNDATKLRGQLNCIYCWFETDMTIKQFRQLFTFSNLEYVKKLSNKIKKTFEIILNGSAEKN